MACGCNKRTALPARPTLRPSIGPRPIQGGSAAGPNPTEIRALSLTQPPPLGETRRLDEQRQRLERMRREAIKKRLS